jgi:membrane protease YdiL (CAAX protease family)
VSEETPLDAPPEPMPSSAPIASPADPRLGPGRAALLFVAYVAVQVAVGMAAGIAIVVWLIAVRGPGALRMGAAGQRALIQQAQSIVLIPASLLGILAAGIVVFLLVRSALPGPIGSPAWRSIGWSGADGRHVLYAALAAVGVYLLFVTCLWLAPPPPDTKWGPLTTAARSGGWTRLGWALIAVLIAPPIEEFVFRGVLFSGLIRSWNKGVAGVLVTTLFAALHFTEVVAYAPAAVIVCLVGVATLIARHASGSLLPAVALHATYNLCIVIGAYLGET